jgi:hypothetical protein
MPQKEFVSIIFLLTIYYAIAPDRAAMFHAALAWRSRHRH